jgi:hypothetical protein
MNFNKIKIFINDLDNFNYNTLTNKFNQYTEDKINVDSRDDYYSLSSVKKSELNYSAFSNNSQIVFKKMDVVPFNFIDNYELKGISSIKDESYFSNHLSRILQKIILIQCIKKIL